MSDINPGGNSFNPDRGNSEWSNNVKKLRIRKLNSSSSIGETAKVVEQRGTSNPGIGAEKTYKDSAGRILVFHPTHSSHKKPTSIGKIPANGSSSLEKVKGILEMMFNETGNAKAAFENEVARASKVFSEKTIDSTNAAPHQVTPGSKVLPLDHPMTLKNLREAMEKAFDGDGDVAYAYKMRN